MEGWSDFYMLIGGTAGTLIGLIFVVITLGAERARKGDTHRTRFFVTPLLVQFAALLVLSLAMIVPISAAARAVALAIIGCAGLLYEGNLALTSRRRTDPGERELVWGVLLPMLSYILIAAAATAWAVGASFAPAIGGIAAVLLLVTALRNSWQVTLAVVGRDPK